MIAYAFILPVLVALGAGYLLAGATSVTSVTSRIHRHADPDAPKPVPEVRKAAVDPAVCPAGTCPVCGMDDPERFALGVGTATWHGLPAHQSCVEWLGDKADDPPAVPVKAVASGVLTIDEARHLPAPKPPARHIDWQQVYKAANEGIVMPPTPAPHWPDALTARFPQMTAGGVAAAQQARGRNVLAAEARSGDYTLLLLRCPDPLNWLLLPDGSQHGVVSQEALDGGFTAVRLAEPVWRDCPPGVSLGGQIRG